MAKDRFGTLMALWQDLMQRGEMRQGQALFNAASHIYPMATEKARGNPELDPFYNNKNVQAFIGHILEVGE